MAGVLRPVTVQDHGASRLVTETLPNGQNQLTSTKSGSTLTDPSAESVTLPAGVPPTRSLPPAATLSCSVGSTNGPVPSFAPMPGLRPKDEGSADVVAQNQTPPPGHILEVKRRQASSPGRPGRDSYARPSAGRMAQSALAGHITLPMPVDTTLPRIRARLRAS